MTALPPWYANSAFWLYLFVWLPIALFVVLYWFRSPWRSTGPGQAVMALAASLFAVLSFVLIVLVFPQIPTQLKDILRTALLSGVGIAAWVLLKNLRTEQRRGRRK